MIQWLLSPQAIPGLPAIYGNHNDSIRVGRSFVWEAKVGIEPVVWFVLEAEISGNQQVAGPSDTHTHTPTLTHIHLFNTHKLTNSKL